MMDARVKPAHDEKGESVPYETILYDVDGAIAAITLNRPEQLNTIVPPMPDEIEAAVHTRIEKLEGIRARRDTRAIADLSDAELIEAIADCRRRLIEAGGDPDAVIAEAEAAGLAAKRRDGKRESRLRMD